MMRPAGFTLVETLVASTLLLIALVGALTLFDESRRTHGRTLDALDRQHGARVALDRIAVDLRTAGAEVGSDTGEPSPDEAIEAALTTALVLRGDFDAWREDRAEPETRLAEDGTFDTVTTGNDEIVAWVLRSATSADELTFVADVAGRVRDGRVEPVRIPGVALRQDDPPYTLYRVTLDEDGAPVRLPLVDGLARLRFVYLDRDGSVIDPPGGDEDTAAISERARIRRVRIEVEARSVDPRGTRAFRLVTEVVPRNPLRGAP